LFGKKRENGKIVEERHYRYYRDELMLRNTENGILERPDLTAASYFWAFFSNYTRWMVELYPGTFWDCLRARTYR
jgi:hypothetical protein